MSRFAQIVTVSLVLGFSYQVAIAAGNEKAPAATAGPVKRQNRILAGAKKVGSGLMTIPFWFQYAMPSTQLNILAGKAHQRGGKTGRFMANTLRVGSVASVALERMGLISLIGGGPGEVAELFTDPMNNMAVDMLVNPLDSPVNAIVVGGNLATIPLTKRAFRRAYNEGQLRELAREFDTTKQDIDMTSQIFRAIQGEDYRHEESRTFFRELQTERRATGAKTIAELALKRFQAKHGVTSFEEFMKGLEQQEGSEAANTQKPAP